MDVKGFEEMSSCASASAPKVDSGMPAKVEPAIDHESVSGHSRDVSVVPLGSVIDRSEKELCRKAIPPSCSREEVEAMKSYGHHQVFNPTRNWRTFSRDI
jgi:hypothetical protein